MYTIQPNELRIGNYVIDNQTHLGNKVCNIGEKGINQWSDMGASGYCCFADIEPIPLTEELLVKCGFGRLKHESYTFGNGRIGLYFDGEYLVYDIAKIKYLHQLQNLYFALTGEELNVEI